MPAQLFSRLDDSSKKNILKIFGIYKKIFPSLQPKKFQKQIKDASLSVTY
jgi:hypothetical protein